jgi:hypothetical protein
VREPREVLWRRLAEAQHGVISRDQFGSAGVGADVVTRMASRGELCRAASGAYLVGGRP